MAMARKDRFRLKSQLVDALNADEWDFQKVNLLFGEFDLDPLDDNWHGPSIVDTIAAVPDSVLIEMYALVMDIDTDEVEDAVEASADASNWKPGYIKLFISHSARHKEFVGQVANELAVVLLQQPQRPTFEAIRRPRAGQSDQTGHDLTSHR